MNYIDAPKDEFMVPKIEKQVNDTIKEVIEALREQNR